MKKSEPIALRDRIENLSHPDMNVNVDLAKLFGWTRVEFDKWADAWRGTNPHTGERLLIPNYTGSTDACQSVVPDKWVESYYRRFDDSSVAKCHPRSDLDMQATIAEASTTPVAMMMAIIDAYIAMAQ